MDDIDWLTSLPDHIKSFMKKMELENGYWKYSLSSDIYDESTHWGLGQTVFAAKILYTVNAITHDQEKKLVKRIGSFKKNNGYINDNLIHKSRRWKSIANGLRMRSVKTFTDEEVRRSETRQSLAALRCLGHKEYSHFAHVPSTKDQIDHYVHSLNWNEPWSAGAHFSHLLFFLYNNNQVDKPRVDHISLILHAKKQLNTYYHAPSGSWSKGHVSDDNRINAAMKVITGFQSADMQHIPDHTKLIDLCLTVAQTEHACGLFNVIYVLYHCNQISDYRKNEVVEFCIKCLGFYREHFHEGKGGFSFYKEKCNDNYYGFKITSGKKEPDMHGTVLFLWGISLITNILDLEKPKFKIPIT